MEEKQHRLINNQQNQKDNILNRDQETFRLQKLVVSSDTALKMDAQKELGVYLIMHRDRGGEYGTIFRRTAIEESIIDKKHKIRKIREEKKRYIYDKPINHLKGGLLIMETISDIAEYIEKAMERYEIYPLKYNHKEDIGYSLNKFLDQIRIKIEILSSLNIMQLKDEIESIKQFYQNHFPTNDKFIAFDINSLIDLKKLINNILEQNIELRTDKAICTTSIIVKEIDSSNIYQRIYSKVLSCIYSSILLIYKIISFPIRGLNMLFLKFCTIFKNQH